MNGRAAFEMGFAPSFRSWRQWVEPWYVAYALLGVSVAGIVPIVLPLAVHGAGGAAHTGFVIAALNLGGLTAPLWGNLADRYRLHRRLALGGVLLTATALALFPYSMSPTAWVGLALLQGMGASGAATVANTFILETHPEAEWDERIGWLQTFYAGGQVGGLFLAAALTQTHLHVGLLVAAGLTGLAALIGWLTTRTHVHAFTPKSVLLRPRQWGERAISSPQHLFRHPTPAAVRHVWRGMPSPFALLLGCWLLTFAGSWTFFSQYPVLMQTMFGVSPWQLSAASAVAHALGLVLYVPAGLFSERYGPRKVLTWALSVRLLAFGSLFSLGYVPFAGRGWVAVLCVIAVVLSWPLLSVSGMGLTARLSPVGEGEGMGLFTATTALAGVTGAALGGWVAEHWGYQASLVLPVVGVGLGLTLAFGLRPIHYGEHTLKSAEGKGAAAGNG